MRPRTLAILAVCLLTSLVAIAASGDGSAAALPPGSGAPLEDRGDDSSAKDESEPSDDAGERAISLLYTIHNAGYVEPCG